MQDETTIKIGLDEQVLTIVAKKGERGEKGDKGDVGEKGEKGDKGENGKDGVNGKDGIDGIDGRDGRDGVDGKDGVDGRDGKDGSPDTPEQVKEKLLSVGIDYSEVQNTPDIPSVIQRASFASKTTSLVELDDVDLSGVEQVNGKYVLGGGGIESIVAGTNISVDNTDPNNPVINATTSTPTGTSGSVAFFGSSGSLSEDNQNLFWHESSKQLDVYSTLGSEKVTNGGFSSATGWTVGSGWSISGGLASHTSNGTATLSQSGIFTNGEEYVVSLTVSALTAGTVTVTTSTTVQSAISANGTYTYRVVAGGNTTLSFTPSNTSRFSLDNVSVKLLSGGSVRTGEINLFGNHSNIGPGTTRMQRFDNSGSYTWTEYRFSGTLRSAVGAVSSGAYQMFASGGSFFEFYTGSAGLSSNTLRAYISTNALVHQSGYGGFSDGVHAGSTSAPTSTLQSAGGTALKVKKITANQTLDNTATKWIVDASSNACAGTPSVACSSYTNSTDCLARDAHGGCTWNPGDDCSTFNYDQTGCEGQYGCTWEQASCSGFGDETTCNSYTGCSWTSTTNDCSNFNEDQTTCENTSGCSWYSGDDCSSSFFDEESCNAQPGCSWNGSSCDGFYNTNCSGSYDTYSCDGTYDTGNCTGTYGSGCFGAASCSGIDDATNCNAETGCAWSTAVTVTLPSILTVPDRDYFIYNASSTGADVIIQPFAGDSVDHTTSITLANYKDAVHISPLAVLESCSGLNESACGSQSGCSQNYSNCSWDSGMGTCGGDPSCEGYADETSCNEATYYGGCSGSYYSSKNWYVFSR